MKLNANATHVKVPLAALRVTGNVRKDFNQDEIESLARSIKADGLLNPITVRPPVEDEHGNKTYEVIAGGRRIRAHQWLCDNGDDFSMIECCVRTGDTWTLQMVENIQRADLTPREKEEAVTAALESGLTMTQIAEKLSKPVQYVSDIVAGMKVRHAADEAGIATERISTKALSQLRSIPAESLPEAIDDLAKSGGTVKEATRILNERKEAQTTPESSTPDYDDPFDIEPEINDETETKQDDTKTRIFEAAKQIISNNNPTDFFFLSISTLWSPKNSLQKDALDFIRPYCDTILPEKAFNSFVIFLKWKIDTICTKNKKYERIEISHDKCTDSDATKIIPCEIKRHNCFDDVIFSIHCTPIKGSAAVRMAEDWAKK